MPGTTGSVNAAAGRAICPPLISLISLISLSPCPPFFLIEAVSYDWNCPQTITPRFTEAETEAHMAPLKARIAELEAQAAARKG